MERAYRASSPTTPRSASHDYLDTPISTTFSSLSLSPVLPPCTESASSWRSRKKKKEKKRHENSYVAKRTCISFRNFANLAQWEVRCENYRKNKRLRRGNVYYNYARTSYEMLLRDSEHCFFFSISDGTHFFRFRVDFFYLAEAIAGCVFEHLTTVLQMMSRILWCNHSLNRAISESFRQHLWSILSSFTELSGSSYMRR